MKHPLLTTTLASLLVATTAFAASPKLFCTAAQKFVETCCCEMKDGKSFCKLTKKRFDKCCCITKEPAEPGTK